MKIIITISDIKLLEAKDDFLHIHPIPQIPDPENEGQTIPEFDTPAKWLEAYIKRHLIKEVARGKQARAKNAVSYQEDNTLIQ